MYNTVQPSSHNVAYRNVLFCLQTSSFNFLLGTHEPCLFQIDRMTTTKKYKAMHH